MAHEPTETYPPLRSDWKKRGGLPDHVRQAHRDRSAQAEQQRLLRFSPVRPQHGEPPEPDAHLGAPGKPDAETGNERVLAHEQQAGDREHHRQRLVVSAGNHGPDQHRIRDGQQRRSALPARIAVRQHQDAGAGEDEGHDREHLQPEHDVVHVLAAELVGERAASRT